MPAPGPVLSPNDPRYGRPVSPPPIYSNRPADGTYNSREPGLGAAGAGSGAAGPNIGFIDPADQPLRPPGAINPQSAAAPPLADALPPTGTVPLPQDGDRTAALSILPPDERPETGPRKELPERLRRQEVSFATKEPAGTIIVDTPNTLLYYVLGNGRAIRYGVRVGRDGFTWTGVQKITRKAEWPDWHPPAEMIERQPYLPRFMAGGPAIRSVRAPCISAPRSIAFTAPTSPRRSASSCHRAASACSTRMSRTCSRASRSAPAWWCCPAASRRRPPHQPADDRVLAPVPLRASSLPQVRIPGTGRPWCRLPPPVTSDNVLSQLVFLFAMRRETPSS